MTETNDSLASPALTSGATASHTPPPVGGDASAQAQKPEMLIPVKPKRTFGLKAVDTIIYPLMTHFGVFALSVWTSYVTNYREPVAPNPNDKWLKRSYDTVCKVMHDRGDKWFRPIAKLFKINESSSAFKEAKIVLFSFLDGCIMAIPIKLLEDRRNEMAKKIDEFAGTKPKDESVYDREVHQTWGSVVGGRAKTALIIVPIASALNKLGTKPEAGEEFKNLNERFLGRGGQWFETHVMERFFPKFNTRLGDKAKDFSFVLAFETFYTAVCTACLYVFSRSIARKQTEKHARKEAEAHVTHPAQADAPQAVSPEKTAAMEAPIHATAPGQEPAKPGYARVPSAEEKAVTILAEKLRDKQPQQWQSRVQESVDPTLAAGFAKA